MNRLFTKAGLLATLGLVALGGHAQTVDGTRDASYPAALAVQTTPTGFGNETSGNQTQAGGSELDNIHAQIVGTDLFVFVGGNLSNNYNKIALFFDSKAGGQNTLRGDNPNVDFNGLNTLAGLHFDTGFDSDYFIGMGCGSNPLQVYANVAETPTGGGGNGNFAGGGVGRTQTIDLDPTAAVLNGEISIDNSNTAGVSDATVGTPATVSTGIEYRIPLAALGTSVGGGNIRIMAFISNGGFDYLSNQVLGGLPNGTGNLAGPSGVNFNNYAGNQYVTVANAAATGQISVSPTTLTFGNVGTGTSATRTFSIANVGGGTLNVTGITSNNPEFTVSPTTTTIASGGASTTVTVSFVPTATGAQSATITIASNDPATPTTTVSVSGNGVLQQAIIGATPASQSFNNVSVGSSATRTVNITNTGTGPLTVTGITSSNGQFSVSPTTATVPVGGNTNVTVTFAPTTAGAQTSTLTIASNDPATPNKTVTVSGTAVAAGQIVVDGTVDAGLYGAAKALQTNPTGFGDNYSELDGAYARVVGSDLYLTLTGNLQNNDNKLVIFLDADPAAGQNVYQATNPVTNGSASLTGLHFDRGFAPESFISLDVNNGGVFANFVQMSVTGSDTYLSTSGNGNTQALNFPGGATGELGFNNSNTGGVTGSTTGNPGAVTTGFELRIPLSALGAGITSTTPLHVMALITNPNYDYLSNQTLGGLPNGVGNLGFDGNGNGNPGGGATSSVDFLNYLGNQFFTAQRGDVNVSSGTDLAGDYRNVTVTAAGYASVYSPLNVSGTYSSQGTLQLQNKPDAVLSGAGTATINGTLVLATAAGIAASGATGGVQTATRSFGTGATYVYNGTVAQSTGSGLPSRVRSLIVNNAAGLSLTQAVGVAELASLESGNLTTGGNAFTLLSTPGSSVGQSASLTAVLDNTGGAVVGTGTMQRAVDILTSDNIGYHHYSAPVSNTTVGDLTAPGFTPVLNDASNYNTAAIAGTVRPFPTVFGYDETRVGSSALATDQTPFNQGFFAPANAGAAMVAGKGYTANVPNAVVVDFVGTFNNAPATTTFPGHTGLTRTNATDGGWQLLGNPFPSPLDYSTVTAAQVTNLDAAIYQYHATSRYTGFFTTYLGNVALGSQPIVDAGAGFFARVTTAGTPGELRLTNANRVTAFGGQPAFGRSGTTRPTLALSLCGAGATDALIVYAEAAATPGVDARYDAVKLPNPNGLNLSALSGNTQLAINGLPGFSRATVVPLALGVPITGRYTLTVNEQINFGSTAVYLRDALTGSRTLLTAGTAYVFTLTGFNAPGRFALEFAPVGAALATAAQALAAQVQLYPNPTAGRFHVSLPAGAKTMSATLSNALGQVVQSRTLAANEADFAVATPGLYTLRLTVDGTTVIRKVVVE